MVRIASVAAVLLVGVLTATTEAFNSIATTSNLRDVVVRSKININRSTAASTSLLRSTVQEVSGSTCIFRAEEYISCASFRFVTAHGTISREQLKFLLLLSLICLPNRPFEGNDRRR
jgi:hypothetical protein